MLWNAFRNARRYPWPTLVLSVLLGLAGYTVSRTPGWPNNAR